MKPYKGICNVCKNEKWLVNAKAVCSECVYRKNHGGKSPREVSYEKQRDKPKVFKKQVIKPKKATGEYDLFLEIWSEREHRCENCKGRLAEIVQRSTFVRYFSHIKSKGSCPELRLDKRNIELLCLKCHEVWEFGDREEFKKRKDTYYE